MADHATNAGHSSGAHADHHVPGAVHVHVMPMKVLITVGATLLVLTWITVVLATQFDLGRIDFGIAMLIATFKASLVVLYFMHLRYDRPLNALLFIGSLAFVAIFITMCLLDTAQYMPEIDARQIEIPVGLPERPGN